MRRRRRVAGSYWFLHANALQAAHRLAATEGVRFRVQAVTWDETPLAPGGWGPWRWYVSPTPAPAPSREVSEPCS